MALTINENSQGVVEGTVSNSNVTFGSEVNETTVTDSATPAGKNSEVTTATPQYGRKSQYNQSEIAKKFKPNDTTGTEVPPRKSFAANLGFGGNNNKNKASFVRGEHTVTEHGLVEIHKLPESLKDLAHRFDRDGTGVLEITEIVDALLYCHEEEVTIARLTKELWFAVATIIILLISVFGLSYASIELAKDFRPEDGTATLVSADGTPIKVGSSDLMVDGNGNLVPQPGTSAARNLQTNDATAVISTGQYEHIFEAKNLNPSADAKSIYLHILEEGTQNLIASLRMSINGISGKSGDDTVVITPSGSVTLHTNQTYTGNQDIMSQLQQMNIDICGIKNMNNPTCNNNSRRKLNSLSYLARMFAGCNAPAHVCMNAARWTHR